MTSRTTAPAAVLIGRTVRTSLAVLALSCVTTTSVYAQTVPAAQAPTSASQASPSTTTTSTNPFTVDQTTLDQNLSLDQAAPAPGAGAPPAGGPNAPTPQGAGPAPGGGPQPRTPTSFSHFPLIDIVTTYSNPGIMLHQNCFPVKGAACQIHAFDPIDVGGTFRLPITKWLYAAFDRITEGTLNTPVDRVINTNPITHVGTITYPGVSRDIVLQYRLDEQLGRSVVLEEGYYFRHRLYANDGSGVSSVPFDCGSDGLHKSGCSTNSTEAHMAYVGVTYTTPRFKALHNATLSVFINGTAQNVDHNVGTVCTAANITEGKYGCTVVGHVGYLDENPSQNRVYETTQGGTLTIPLNPGASVSARYRWGALNWYENQPFPFRWAGALDLAVNKNFGRAFTLTLRHSDQHSLEFGTTGVNGLAPLATFLTPNVIHVASFDVLGTFHVDTGKIFK